MRGSMKHGSIGVTTLRALASWPAALGAALGASTARAAPEEIQVYMNEMDVPGEFGLDLHNNFVLSGSPSLEYPGAQQSLHRYRLTPEFSYGLTRSIDLGAYLPLVTMSARGDLSVDGVKMRIKYIAPKSFAPNTWWGLNLEVGKVDHGVDLNPWNAEFKTIVGGRFGRWTLAANGNFDWAIAGPRPGPVTLDVDAKIAYRVTPDTQVGVETYSGLGALRRLGGLADEEQLVYIVADTTLRHFDLNIGLGRGFGGSQDDWVIKAIVGVPLR
ncbi:MAG: hypothetical protein RL684_426 [Pseudomonadota bacterium]|jgi:hypothetical protein